jgi:phosphoribosylglycinamide formyltransferase-1
MHSPYTKIAVFASGSGTNTEALVQYFKEHPSINVTVIFTNQPNAGVVQVAEHYDIPVYTFRKKTLYQEPAYILKALKAHQIDFLVLAGFLLLMPETIVEAYHGRIVNIHPALLPKYGGKGMYGRAVHQAVLQNQESVSGITIHYVNEAYDEGQVIEQVKCTVYPEEDTVDDLQMRVRQLELYHYPRIVEQVIEGFQKYAKA